MTMALYCSVCNFEMLVDHVNTTVASKSVMFDDNGIYCSVCNFVMFYDSDNTIVMSVTFVMLGIIVEFVTL